MSRADPDADASGGSVALRALTGGTLRPAQGDYHHQTPHTGGVEEVGSRSRVVLRRARWPLPRGPSGQHRFVHVSSLGVSDRLSWRRGPAS